MNPEELQRFWRRLVVAVLREFGPKTKHEPSNSDQWFGSINGVSIPCTIVRTSWGGEILYGLEYRGQSSHLTDGTRKRTLKPSGKDNQINTDTFVQIVREHLAYHERYEEARAIESARIARQTALIERVGLTGPFSAGFNVRTDRTTDDQYDVEFRRTLPEDEVERLVKLLREHKFL